MLRPITCAALVVSSLIPAEQPAAHAESWHAIADTPYCVDYDSEQFDNEGASWSFKLCDPAESTDVWHGKVDCAHQSFDSDAPLTWILDDGTGTLTKESSPGSPERPMVVSECDGWALA